MEAIERTPERFALARLEMMPIADLEEKWKRAGASRGLSLRTQD